MAGKDGAADGGRTCWIGEAERRELERLYTRMLDEERGCGRWDWYEGAESARIKLVVMTTVLAVLGYAFAPVQDAARFELVEVGHDGE